MYNEAQTAKERPSEGAHGAGDPFRGFFDGVDSTAAEDVTGLGDLEVLKKSPSSDSVLHHETFLRCRDELNQLEAEVRGLTEKIDTYKLLSEQREGEAMRLPAEFEVARKKHADLAKQVKIFEFSNDELDTVTNGQNVQVQQKIDQVDQLRAEMDAIKAEVEEWRGMMDCLASKKETARTQLTSEEVQLQAAKEKAKVWAQKVEELQSQLSSAVTNRETLAKEFKKAKSMVAVVKVDAEEMVAQYKVDAEAAQDRLKDILEHAKRQSRRETLEEIHARGFDLSAEIEIVKRLEAEAKKLTYLKDEEDSEGSSGSEGGGDSEDHGDEAGSGEDQAV
ncbi:MAR-binding filament-like protein 1 [Nicotiana tomentosiformis]|uniref:MAR-binding filament-like protein 1 n=1 Tax=Nicotiana tomentosiformis TaxID=4098 RepID=UPI00388C9F51